jgi:cysteine desulfurase / selenocysteine lyase
MARGAGTMIDVERARAETPGCGRVLHFNNAGAALPAASVLQTVIGHLELEAAVGGYEAARRAEAAVEGVYGAIGRLLGCAPDEIALVENATRAWDMAFYALEFRPGDRIVTAAAEYASNYIAFLQVARRSGAEIVVVPGDADGRLSLAALEAMVDERVKLIAVTHVPTHRGLVNPAAAVGRVARRLGIPFLLDACQSAGQIPLDVEAIGCDMLSATGRKYLRGPRGTGFLYVRRALAERLEPPFLDLHAATWTAPAEYRIRPDARRFENWEHSVAGRLGLGAAVVYALDLGIPAIQARVARLAAQLGGALDAVPGVRRHDGAPVECGIVTFTVAHRPAADVGHRLAGQGINVWVSSVTSARLDMAPRGLDAVVRASVHYYNTEEEIERFCRAVAAC